MFGIVITTMHTKDNSIKGKYENKNCLIEEDKNFSNYTQKFCKLNNYLTTPISPKNIYMNGDKGTTYFSISKILVLKNIDQTIVDLTNTRQKTIASSLTNSKKDEFKIKKSKIYSCYKEDIKTICKKKNSLVTNLVI